ncbi:MAG TPA: solute carrier family 23 protein, partial [Thermodesulfobacteriota bacterium]|nr:solute carrier family 23 protein [Thermodesulfobacteriota bacterium]
FLHGVKMKSESYIYGIDDHLPVLRGILYGLQWAFIAFPGVIIAASLCGKALNLDPVEEIRFLQFSLLTTGLFTLVQTVWGHRYPLIEGPSTALILTFMLLVPLGLPAIQGGTIMGGTLLVVTVLSKQLKRIIRLFTPNVVGVILMLIAFGLLAPLLGFISGVSDSSPQGEAVIVLVSLGLILLMTALAYHLSGFWKTVSILCGMILGSLLFLMLGRLDWGRAAAAAWISIPDRWLASRPAFQWPAAVAFACAYLAVVVNSLGSLQGIAAITDEKRLPTGIDKGILVNGISGIVCGLLGVVGTVSYSVSPGVIIVNRVASRFALTYCSIILLLAVFLPKLSAVLATIPLPVVGSALCVAMGGQVGAGIAIIASHGITSRDYFVVGLPVLIGTLAGFFPPGLFEPLPGFFSVFLGNSLIVGISMVLLLEHVLWRRKEPTQDM